MRGCLTLLAWLAGLVMLVGSTKSTKPTELTSTVKAGLTETASSTVIEGLFKSATSTMFEGLLMPDGPVGLDGEVAPGAYSYGTLYKNKINTFEFLMPQIVPNAVGAGLALRADNHLCMQILIRDNFYIVGFEPRASMDVVHQMILYGCRQPGSERDVWACSASPGTEITRRTARTSSCLAGSQVLYGWTKNATGLRLPRHVGFYVGPDSPITHLVLQVHYLKRYKGRKLVVVDDTGVVLSYTKQRMRRLAGVVMLGARGVLPARSTTRLDTCCALQENKTIHPFAFRVHTHDPDAVVSCYAVRAGVRSDAWRTLGKAGATRVAYMPVRDATPLRPGDLLAARCTLRNPTSHVVVVGKSERDAACQVYLMYWVPAVDAAGEHGAKVVTGVGEEPLSLKFCVSAGPPHYSWNSTIHGFRNIPHLQASIL